MKNKRCESKSKINRIISVVLLTVLLLTSCTGPRMDAQNGTTTTEGANSQQFTEGTSDSEDVSNTNSNTDNENNSNANQNSEATVQLPQAGERSIANLLLTALQPVGNTMYIWGGGWNEEDTAAGVEAVTIGVSPHWAEFAKLQNDGYDYNTTRYQIHDGLDCSGYIGWSIYNVMETENGKEGYVMKATDMAKNFSERGWGNYTEIGSVTKWKAGDIMSMKGHVWMVIGTCDDGSVVFMHASPPGVAIAGTVLSDGSHSEAVALAQKYMSTYYPDWYERYPDCSKGYSYLSTSASMSWNEETLSDDEGLCEMSAEEVLKWMFENVD